jgi:hypothetical protein
MTAAEIACAFGDARREGRARRCLCPLHGGTASSCAMAMAVACQITWGVVVFTSYRDGRMSVISSDRVGDRSSHD